jgi:hypothetical protein
MQTQFSPAGGGSSRELSVRLVEDVPGVGRAGDSVLMAMMPSDVVNLEDMDTFMLHYAAPGYRADEACPIQLVGQDQGRYRIFGQSNAYRPVVVISSIQADIPEVDPESTFAQYMVQERALGGFIPTVTQVNIDESGSGYDLKTAVGMRIEAALALDRELRVFGPTGVFCTSTNWNANNRVTLGGGAKWNDAVNADPIRDITDRIHASAQPVTGIWLSPLVGHSILQADRVRSYFRTIQGDSPLSSQFAEASTGVENMDFSIPGLPPFHVVASKVLNETTGLLDFILDDTVVLVSNPAGGAGNGEQIMTAKTFRRRGPSGTGYTSREFNLERRGLHGGTFLASGHAEVVKMIAGDCGGVIYNTLQ